ncbi:hypothetical protein Pat9b_5092 (plasmid) [Pantoea sp. At-9b]|nr:hypothetical protein Pat9b_5092 [Pantoea sp. At-9b]
MRATRIDRAVLANFGESIVSGFSAGVLSGVEVLTRVFADRCRSTDCGNRGDAVQVLTVAEAPWDRALPRSLCQGRNTRLQE